MPQKLRIDDFSDVDLQINAKSVPNPQEAYNEVIRILRFDCDIDIDDISENQYEHEISGETEMIFSEIRAREPKDEYSHVYIKVKVYIEMRPAKSDEYDYVGDIEISGSGRVRTDYPQQNWLQKSILWHAFRAFYEKVIYGDVKQVFINDANEYMRKLRDGLKGYFDMLPTIK